MIKTLSEHHFPADLKTMSEKELSLLSYQIRDFLIEKVSTTGGHLASNLGVVELTIALHQVFDSPKDKIIWDVGHQSYVHKILTGRADGFDQLRLDGGLSGFPKRAESEHDMHDSGHASTSISVALGYAHARDLAKEEHEVVAVIGDGSMTGGVAFEAMNNVGAKKPKLIVILNDNEMSIGKNIGSLSKHLAKLRTTKSYQDIKKQVKKTIKGIPGVGTSLVNGIEHIKDSVRYAVIQGAIFESFGFHYLGPIDGHNLHELTEVFTVAKSLEGPVLIHVVTKKGKGYRNAELDPSKFHGIAAFDRSTGELLCPGQKTYSKVFGRKLVNLAETDSRIVAVSAAMVDATGLGPFQSLFPERLFDVGIAEQHAVSFAAGLALAGFRPFVAIYSTFLQRSYDQIIEDVCLQNLPVVFLIDRAGIVGNDGETHHGLYDLSFLSHIPNLTVMAPKDGDELEEMIDYAYRLGTPCAIRYPRGKVPNPVKTEAHQPIDGCCELLCEGSDVTVVAVGRMVSTAMEAAEDLYVRNISCEVINARFVKPADLARIAKSLEKTRHLVTVEDNVKTGGFGDLLLSELTEVFSTKAAFRSNLIAWPDQFIKHGDTAQLFEEYRMDRTGLADRIGDFVEGKA